MLIIGFTPLSLSLSLLLPLSFFLSTALSLSPSLFHFLFLFLSLSLSLSLPLSLPYSTMQTLRWVLCVGGRDTRSASCPWCRPRAGHTWTSGARTVSPLCTGLPLGGTLRALRYMYVRRVWAILDSRLDL